MDEAGDLFYCEHLLLVVSIRKDMRSDTQLYCFVLTGLFLIYSGCIFHQEFQVPGQKNRISEYFVYINASKIETLTLEN